MPGDIAIEVIRAMPVGAQAAEDLAEVANALNETLAGVGLWVDLVHGPRSVYFVLLRVR